MSYLKNITIDGQALKELQPGDVMWKGSSKFGIMGGDNTGVAIHPLLLQRHMLFIGSIGSGKSVSMYHLIEGLRKNLSEDDVMIVFDAKGDYLKTFYQDDDYVLTNETEQIPGLVRWNIFEDILSTKKEKQDEVIWEIASSLFKEDIESSSSPIFATGARDLFAAILVAIVRESEETGLHWNHALLVEWIQKATDVTVRNLLLKHKDLSWVRNYINKDNDVRTNQSFFMHLYQNIFSIFSGTFKEAGSFSLTRAIKERNGRAIFLEYDIASGNVLKPIFTLILDIAMKNVLGQKEEDCKGNIYFILDEFPLIPKLNYMDSALNFGRSLGVKIIAGIQNVGQVKNVYSDSLGESILSGFGTIFAFRLFDEPSRSFIIHRHGRSKKMVAYNSSNSSKGVQDMLLDGYVIEDWDLTDLSIGECIVSPFNGEPFKFYPVNFKK
ncbi:type IV secretion system DNA-binding domain-containing protein [Mesobacillus subterraneus]|uniref:type IV secretory system conjugative DNA transfer family protein n=1 Tax=Mesobacillus subterraneus TaxID=285983 RepID=UPI001CFF2981|nr:type IV secretion system DNA-binding domain-containing protein [Mesobacillus subterraneus]WLR55500.1 type IV secretion system DNA-binding domain-containing protein [Mesobacillus subterraneus]